MFSVLFWFGFSISLRVFEVLFVGLGQVVLGLFYETLLDHLFENVKT